MSKLNKLRKALYNSGRLAVVETIVENNLFSGLGDDGHEVNILVAPVVGEYDEDELNSMMFAVDEVVGGSSHDRFRLDLLKKVLHYGMLRYLETIGDETVCRKVALTDEDMFETEGFDEQGLLSTKRTNVIQRRITVRFYPDLLLASRSVNGVNETSITMRKLKKAKRAMKAIA